MKKNWILIEPGMGRILPFLYTWAVFFWAFGFGLARSVILHERAFRFLRRLPFGSSAAAGTLCGRGLHSRAASAAPPLVSLHRLLTSSAAAAASSAGFWLLHLPPNPGAGAQRLRESLPAPDLWTRSKPDAVLAFTESTLGIFGS